MELIPHVQEKLISGHKLNTVVEAGLVEDFVKTTRIVALVEYAEGSGGQVLQAILVYRTARVPVHSSIDLKLEWVLPVDGNLKCEIDTSSTDVDTDVLVNLCVGRTRLLIEMPFSQRTNTFVSEVLRAAEGFSKRRGAIPEFNWLNSYKEMASHKSGFDMSSMEKVEQFDSIPHEEDQTDQNILDIGGKLKGSSTAYDVDSISNRKSPDLGMNRHSIALGVSPTPIAARESHIRHQMALREEAYTDIHNYGVFVGTWNVNGQYPSIGLSEWLSADADPPDIYAVAFQELDLNKEAFLFNVTPREQEWLNAVLNGVHPKAKYHKLRLVRLVGMMLIVLVQEKHMAYVRNVACDCVGTGIMNKMGNKGGVSIRLDIHNTSVCFVNAHMAAHVEEFERRNEDHDCIFLRTTFNVNISGPQKSIRDHDHIYFFGDMNYRLNATPDVNLKETADSGNYKKLLEIDQLIQQVALKRVFHNFKEGEITFKPSFKYDLYSDNWDSSEKCRQPAWCDRILYYGDTINLREYRSHPSLNISDHKPVSALFTSGIKVIDTRRYRRIYEEVMKKLDKLENEFLPQVTVDTTEVILDTVRFMQPQTMYLMIANTGQVPVQFEFIKKLNEGTHCKPWLCIRPYSNFIMPGEKCDVSLEVIVDKQTAWKLNCGNDKLYDILVLHLDGGKDIFITITGDYERSCFGSSINALVHMNKPFREIPLSSLIDLESESPKHLLELPYAIPKEIWFLVDNIHATGLGTEGLFTTSARQKELIEIRTCLDDGVLSQRLPGRVHAIAVALLLFLEALPEPVIHSSCHSKAMEASNSYSLCKQIISMLPDHHRNVFTYLIAFLKELLLNNDQNGLDPKTLALVFGSVLIRGPNDEKCQNSNDERRKQSFVFHFLVNEDD